MNMLRDMSRGARDRIGPEEASCTTDGALL